MSTIYDPNQEMEFKVVKGLLQSLDFLRHFVDSQVASSIFEAEDNEVVRRIVDIAVHHFKMYGTTIKIGYITEEITRNETERENKDLELLLLQVKRVFKGVLKAKIVTSELPYHLSTLIEIHKNYRILANTKELTRFYRCKFEHGKHDSCKGCPFWTTCKQMQKTVSQTFSDRLFFMQEYMNMQLRDATGGTKTEKSQMSKSLKGSLERYEQRKTAREEGGENFTFGIKTPWPTVTKATDGWKAGKLYGIWAPKKMGKTTCLLMVAADAIRDKANVALFAMEDTKAEWIDKFMCQQAGLPNEEFRDGRLSVSEDQRLHDTYDNFELAWENSTIGDIHQYHGPIGKIGLDDMEHHLDFLVSQGHKIDVVIIDHIHIMRKPYGRGVTRDDLLLNFIVESLKRFSQKYNCAVICAAQLKTSGDRKGQARGSDQLEDCFDAVWHLKYNRGCFELEVSVSRDFAPFTVELENRRHRGLLPEMEYVSATYDETKLELTDDDWL